MPSMAFAVKVPARLPLDPFTRVSLTTPQTSLHAADRPVATPSTRCRCSASTLASQPTPGAVLPGTLASPRTGLPPAGCPKLVARLRHVILLDDDHASELLDAHFPRTNPVGPGSVVVRTSASRTSIVARSGNGIRTVVCPADRGEERDDIRTLR